MVYTAAPDKDPTEEFNDYCLGIIKSWEAGDLPFNEAIALLTAKEQEAVAANHLANQGRAHHLLGYMQHYRGNLNTSIIHYEKARSLFQRVDNIQRLAILDLNNGENYRLKGDFSRAKRMYRFAYEKAKDLGLLTVQTMAVVNEGHTALAVGQFDNAEVLLQEGIELTEQWTERFDVIDSLRCEIYLAMTEIAIAQKQIEQAWQYAKLTLQHAENSGDVKLSGFAYRAIGEVISILQTTPESGFSDDPDEYFRQSLQVFREMNMEAEMARTIYAQARSLARRGRRTTAARKLQQVMIMFTELGMVDDAAKAAEAQLSVI